MIPILKKSFFTIIFNSSLFLILIIGLQNSSNKNNINLLINKTVKLPIGFIVGISFISGSIIGDLMTTDFKKYSKKYF